MKIPKWMRSDGGAEVIGVKQTEKTMSIPVVTGDREFDETQYFSSRGSLMDHRRTGWTNPKGLGHMCLPPDAYEEGWGPGSIYGCTSCGAPWQAIGIRSVTSEYRWYGHGASMMYGPKQYRYIGDPNEVWVDHNGNKSCPVSVQESFYDWRDPGEVICGQLDRIGVILNKLNANIQMMMDSPRVVEYPVRNDFPDRTSNRAAHRREDVEGG